MSPRRAASPGRRTGRAGLVLACALAVAAPASPALAAPPAPDPYVRSVACFPDVLSPVTQGVSAAQRELGWARLAPLSTGRGVTVAVIDSGVNPVPALAGRVRGGGDLVAPSEGTRGLSDCDGHGTVVAGILAGAPDTTTGFVGVAPEATVLAIRQSSNHYAPRDRSAGSTAGTPATLAQALDSAVAQGARVVNVSAAACGPAISADPAPLAAAVRRAVARDVVVVVAAGNAGDGACRPQNPLTGPEVTAAWPARIPQVLTVGAVTTDDAPATWSLRGSWVDVAAPGDRLVAPNPHVDGTGQVDSIVGTDGVLPLQGTSFATPVVAGVAALVRARFPRLTAEQVVHRITVTATHPAGSGERTKAVGYGVVDPRLALTAVLPEEGAAGKPVGPGAPSPAGTAAAGPAALPAPPHVADDPLPRQVALGGTGLLALGVVAFALVHLGRRPRGHVRP